MAGTSFNPILINTQEVDQIIVTNTASKIALSRADCFTEMLIPFGSGVHVANIDLLCFFIKIAVHFNCEKDIKKRF